VARHRGAIGRGQRLAQRQHLLDGHARIDDRRRQGGVHGHTGVARGDVDLAAKAADHQLRRRQLELALGGLDRVLHVGPGHCGQLRLERGAHARRLRRQVAARRARLRHCLGGQAGRQARAGLVL
jgi:hypothetical protein